MPARASLSFLVCGSPAGMPEILDLTMCGSTWEVLYQVERRHRPEGTLPRPAVAAAVARDND